MGLRYGERYTSIAYVSMASMLTIPYTIYYRSSHPTEDRWDLAMLSTAAKCFLVNHGNDSTSNCAKQLTTIIPLSMASTLIMLCKVYDIATWYEANSCQRILSHWSLCCRRHAMSMIADLHLKTADEIHMVARQSQVLTIVYQSNDATLLPAEIVARAQRFA